MTSMKKSGRGKRAVVSDDDKDFYGAPSGKVKNNYRPLWTVRANPALMGTKKGHGDG